jgi:chromosome segregation ATPase
MGRTTLFIIHKKLEEFLTNKEKSFVEVADRICDAERKLSETQHKLSLVTKQLEQNNQRYRTILDRQEQQIIRLEQMEVDKPDEAQESFDGVKPSINGFYAIKKESPFLAVPTHGAAMITVL